jgi:hypothetical protein
MKTVAGLHPARNARRERATCHGRLECKIPPLRRESFEPPSGEVKKALEIDSGIACHAAEGRRPEPNGVMICERQLPPFGIAVDAMRAPPSNEDESCTPERTKHSPRR